MRYKAEHACSQALADEARLYDEYYPGSGWGLFRPIDLDENISRIMAVAHKLKFCPYCGKRLVKGAYRTPAKKDDLKHDKVV